MTLMKALLCFSLLLLIGCADTIDDWIYGEPTFSPPYDVPFDDVWDALIETVQQNYEFEKINKEEKKFTSKWVVQLAPIRGHGYRLRVDGRVEEEQGRYMAGVRVVYDKNDELERPLVLDEAEWQFDHREAVIELQILQGIHYRLQKEFGPSPQLRKELQLREDRDFERKLRNYR